MANRISWSILPDEPVVESADETGGVEDCFRPFGWRATAIPHWEPGCSEPTDPQDCVKTRFDSNDSSASLVTSTALLKNRNVNLIF